MPLEIDIYNLRKRISDRVEELTEIVKKKEHELEEVQELLRNGQSILIDITGMEKAMDNFIDRSGGLIETD